MRAVVFRKPKSVSVGMEADRSFFDKMKAVVHIERGTIDVLRSCFSAVYIDELIDLVASKKVVLDDIITHEVPLAEAPHAYEIFNKKQDRCLKVVMRP